MYERKYSGLKNFLQKIYMISRNICKIWARFGQDLGKIYATFSKKVFLLYVDQAIRGCGKKVCFSLRLIGICRLAHKKFLAAKYFLEIFMKNFLMSVQNFQNLEFLKSNIFKIWNFQIWVFPKSEISKIQYFSNSNNLFSKSSILKIRNFKIWKFS